jgi:hypothetical protein
MRTSRSQVRDQIAGERNRDGQSPAQSLAAAGYQPSSMVKPMSASLANHPGPPQKYFSA